MVLLGEKDGDEHIPLFGGHTAPDGFALELCMKGMALALMGQGDDLSGQGIGKNVVERTA